MKRESLSLGGQAIIEGVLIKSSSNYAIAVRGKNKKIFVKKFPYRSWTRSHSFLQLPLIRGCIVLAETVVIGIRALSFSAEKASGKREELSSAELVLTFLVSLVGVLLLFKLLPLWVAMLVQTATGTGQFIFTLLDGLLKITMFVTYIYVIGRMRDVKRLFEYHGAEHMAVHCFESGRPLVVRNVKTFPPEHPRCGTAFILFVFLASVLVYLFIPARFSLAEKFGWRLILLPLIVGLSYEWIKFGGSSGKLARITSEPGLWLQKLTTKRPSSDKIEVAISALKRVVR